LLGAALRIIFHPENGGFRVENWMKQWEAKTKAQKLGFGVMALAMACIFYYLRVH